MSLFLLTNTFLDISVGVIWWVTKNTASLVYNGVLYMMPNDIDNDNDNNNDNNSENLNNDDSYENLTKDEIKELLELKNDIKDIKHLLVQKEKNK